MAVGATLMATGGADAQTTATRRLDQTPQQLMIDMVSGYGLTQMVHVAAKTRYRRPTERKLAGGKQRTKLTAVSIGNQGGPQ